jgi:hypothetical protein
MQSPYLALILHCVNCYKLQNFSQFLRWQMLHKLSGSRYQDLLLSASVCYWWSWVVHLPYCTATFSSLHTPLDTQECGSNPPNYVHLGHDSCYAICWKNNSHTFLTRTLAQAIMLLTYILEVRHIVVRLSALCHVRWVPCHHGMVRPQVVDGGDDLQI